MYDVKDIYLCLLMPNDDWLMEVLRLNNGLYLCYWLYLDRRNVQVGLVFAKGIKISENIFNFVQSSKNDQTCVIDCTYKTKETLSMVWFSPI